MEEKKVAYSVTRYSGEETCRYKGIGKLIGSDLYMFKNKVLEDITKYCHPIPYKPNEFKGGYNYGKLFQNNRISSSREHFRCF